MPIVTLPRGVRMTAALLQQIINQCGTCNPCGSGSGSGSGSGRIGLACCDGASGSSISWEFTGTTGDPLCLANSAVSGDFTSACLSADYADDPVCGAYGSNAAFVNIVESCTQVIDGQTINTDVFIDLCCIEPNDGEPFFVPFYRLTALLVVENITVPNTKVAKWCTDVFDIASCSPFDVEMDNWAPYLDGFGGARLSVVIT